MPTTKMLQTTFADLKFSAERAGYQMVIEIPEYLNEEDITLSFKKDGKDSPYYVQVHPDFFYIGLHETIWETEDLSEFGPVLHCLFGTLGENYNKDTIADAVMEKIGAPNAPLVPIDIPAGTASNTGVCYLLKAIGEYRETCGELEVTINPEGGRLGQQDLILISNGDREIKVIADAPRLRIEAEEYTKEIDLGALKNADALKCILEEEFGINTPTP
ncbi:hypothetical protein [Roseibium sp. RKSG952]|uniref:hypothetical protein n=1 Tax=Roseibium sp. RKSG952 TaxID=2529384 RepID=UPI0012BC0450|nr:hypothetical protein [Roseibium sp. RKSG952]MTH95072.1 hypothetical protein [Roseibium sp. RKSG952]